MKTLMLTAMIAATIFAGGTSFARGPAASSFAPKGPEPHSTLADVHGRKSSHKIVRKTSHQKAGAVRKRAASHYAKAN